MRTIAISVLTLPLALSVLGACGAADKSMAGPAGPDAQSSNDSFFGYDAALEEYRAATREFDLPAGATYPADPLQNRGDSYQEGFGRGRAVFYWNCAWGRELLAAHGVDEERARVAFERYASVRETDVYAKNWDPISIQQPFIEALDAAELGDLSLVRADVSANCPG